MTTTILHGNCLDVLKTLPDNSVHMAVTSPPYWGLRAYGTEGQVWPNPDGTVLCQGEHAWADNAPHHNGQVPQTKWVNVDSVAVAGRTTTNTCTACGAWRGELGHEPTPSLYVAHLVAIMREVRRVLRDDATCWLNLGDSYASIGHKKSNSGYGTTTLAGGKAQEHTPLRRENNGDGLKHKDLVGIPWRVAFALQDDGWWLRQDIIWAKPNPMPESVTDRCTKSHEYMFLLAKSARYYYDAEAVKEPATTGMNESAKTQPKFGGNKYPNAGGDGPYSGDEYEPSGSRNRRSVWTITTKPFREAHFATFPPDLVEPCIKAGTSQHGVCATCGAPWERVVERERLNPVSREDRQIATGGAITGGIGKNFPQVTTISESWHPTCTCNAAVAPATVLDPFNGAGTTGVVAKSLGRNYVGIELNPAYVEMAQRRIDKTQAPLL